MISVSKDRFVHSPYYHDVPLFLVLIPIISAINYYLTYSGIRLNGFLLLTFTIDTVQGYLAWLAVRKLILYLDKRMPYRAGALRRILFQLIATTSLGLLIISLLTELVSWIAKGEPAPLHFYTLDLVIIGIWFLVVNGIYIGLHFYREWQRSEFRAEHREQPAAYGLMVSLGKKELLLRFEEVAGFFVEDGHVLACDKAGKRYLQEQSLDRLEQLLPDRFFFRLNRQFILHRQLISGFRRAKNGKLTVLVHHHVLLPAEITVSRTKAPLFKDWFRP